MSVPLPRPSPPWLTVPLTAAVLRHEDLRGLGERLLCLADAAGRQAVQLDLAAVEVPTAGGLGGLLALHRELTAAGIRLALCNVRGRAYEVFAVTRLTDLLDVR